MKGTAAAAAAIVAVDVLSGCSHKNDGPGDGGPVVVDKDSGTNVLDTYDYDDSTVSPAATYDLPLGCVLSPAEGNWIPVMVTGASASPMATGSAMDSRSGKLVTVVDKPISNSPNMEIYSSSCSDAVYAWVELNILDRGWKLYGQPFSEGTLSGKPSLLWEADADWEPPALACTGSKVIWQVEPAVGGKKTSEKSHCYLWKSGDSSAKAVIESPGRFGCGIAISEGAAILVPRVKPDDGTFYGITAYSLSDDLSTIQDQLVLPQSVRPLCATRIGGEFVFSIEASYDSGGLLGSMGTYIGHGDGPFLVVAREPICVSSGKNHTYIVKVRASYYVIDTDAKKYRVIPAVDRALSYGEFPARYGSCDTFVSFSTVKDASSGYPSGVTVRTFGL